MNLSRYLIKGLSFLFLPTFYRFQQVLKHPLKAQYNIKKKILKQLSLTVYGQSLGIHKNSTWQDIPIVTYDDLETWIKQQRKQPDMPILTANKIYFWEQTSGSSGAKKWIPYTAALIGSFSRMFCIWAYDLIHYSVDFCTGKTYLCISPQIGNSDVGIDDTEYLSPPLRWLSRQFLVRLDRQHFPDQNSFRWELAIALLSAVDLEILSLWSPSFLTIQLDFIQTHHQELAAALGNKISLTRRKYLLEIPIPWEQLWPELKLISCWDRMYAADQSQSLRQYFPTVFIQGKGLLATEAPMTIPLVGAAGFVPLVNQIVLEFIAPDGEILGVTELQQNVIYELVISQLGGLVRYRIGDRLKVSHWYYQTPCLEFVGRGNQVSDLVGEKLTVDFVQQILQKLGVLDWGFCFLAPVLTNPPHYCLFLERSPLSAVDIARSLEAALQTGFHYCHARSLGQLDPAQVTINPNITAQCREEKRLGDRKYPLLQVEPFDPFFD
ncbi:MAG: GH3 auxin-responsive promoter family protein [Limnothrix sp. RL_2_0]|nr:GH3 auxin-responsive promoter family protein [Limnothrix sp. RL_2_0]